MEKLIIDDGSQCFPCNQFPNVLLPEMACFGLCTLSEIQSKIFALMSFDLAVPLIASAINLRKVAPPHFNLLRGLGAVGAGSDRFIPCLFTRPHLGSLEQNPKRKIPASVHTGHPGRGCLLSSGAFLATLDFNFNLSTSKDL